MVSKKCLIIGSFVLLCSQLCTSHRVLLMNHDEQNMKLKGEDPSQAALSEEVYSVYGSSSGQGPANGGVGVGQGSGYGSGTGYGSGSGSGSGYGSGSGSSSGSGSGYGTGSGSGSCSGSESGPGYAAGSDGCGDCGKPINVTPPPLQFSCGCEPSPPVTGNCGAQPCPCQSEPYPPLQGSGCGAEQCPALKGDSRAQPVPTPSSAPMNCGGCALEACAPDYPCSSVEHGKLNVTSKVSKPMHP